MRRPPASFAEQVAERLKSKDRLGAMLEAPTTPAVLRMLGFPEAPLVMSPAVLFKLASGKDGSRPPLSEQQIAQLPEYIDDPVLIIKDADETVVVLSQKTDAGDQPIVICVRASCRDGLRTVNSIRSAFGKDRPTEWLERHVESILYIGEKINPRLPLPTPICNPAGALETEGLNETILRPANLRKYREDVRSAKLALAVAEALVTR